MKKILIVLLLFVLVGVDAQQVEPTPKTITVDPLQLLSDVREDLSGLKATFVQYELINGSEKVDINTGLVWMKSPDRFRWHYKDPIEQLIIADGKQVWVYDEDLEQVTVKKSK